MTPIRIAVTIVAAWLGGVNWLNESSLIAATIEKSTTLKTSAESANPASLSTSEADLPADAAQLVEKGLAAGLEGHPQEREKFLKLAVAADPNYAPARWHRGEVRFEGGWRTLEAVHERVAANPYRAEYASFKSESADDLASHARLADWCLRQGFENEERFHWLKVLMADPEHQRARSRLGLRPYQGGLYTQWEIDEIQSKKVAAEANLKKYRPLFSKLCRQATSDQSTEREQALKILREVNNLEQLPALERAIRQESRRVKAESIQELYLAFLASVAKSSSYEATVTLLNYALYAETPQVRQAAARSLRDRPVTDYVPRLMASLTAPIEGDVVTHVSPDGTVSYGEMFFQAGPLSDQRFVRNRDHVINPVPRGEMSAVRFRSVVAREAERRLISATEMANRTQRQVATINAQSAAGNARVREVLSNALNIDFGNDPKQYWESWISYNELQFDEHPVQESEESRAFVAVLEVRVCSCFMSGTPVWTQEGPRPIETIAVGDLVLAQHPVTGEVAYRPVLEKTVRAPAPTVSVVLTQETIVATRGHRFWVEGHGWEMAKLLKPEMALHSLTSMLPIKAIEPSEDLECHNMVVEGFHTYFVGQSQVLVHDNTCPWPTQAKMPGYSPKREAAADVGKVATER